MDAVCRTGSVVFKSGLAFNTDNNTIAQNSGKRAFNHRDKIKHVRIKLLSVSSGQEQCCINSSGKGPWKHCNELSMKFTH